MNIGLLAIVMGSLIIQSGSEATSKSIVKVGQSIEIAGRDIRLGLKDAGNGIGNGIGFGLISFALAYFAVGMARQEPPGDTSKF